MSPAKEGTASSRKGRGGRTILTLQRIGSTPQDRSPPASIERDHDTADLTDLQLWEQAMWNARNAWSIAQARRGLFGPIRKADADRMLRRALAALEGVGE